MRKTFTLFLTMILVVLTVCLQTLSAQTDRHNVQNSPSGRLTHVTSAQALEVGYAFMRTNTHSRGNVNVSKQSMRLVYTGVAKDSVTRAVTDCYYVFSLQPTGFVMVAADERVRPILGYSYSNNFVAEDIPDNVRSWLENYSKQIKTAIDNDSQSCSETRTMWELLRSGRATATRNITSIAPLLQTTWDQGCYYNQFCPEDSLGSCGHVWAGCVAVAMAQVVRYWEWPNHGLNSHSYTCDYGTLSVNFGATTYNYNNMPNGLSSSTSTSQKEEVAKLIYHCGVAVEMDYAPGGSSAYSSDVPDALYDYFAYADNGTYVSRYNYSDSDWVNLIKHELDSLRPVYYSGHGTGGHAFVCDGYDNSGFFHINWGWNGWYDGYFELSALTPSTSNFSSDQAAIIGIRSSGTFMRCSDSELSFFARVGEESAPQSISVCGHGLSGNISVSAGSGFKVSSDGANYYDILTLPAAGGTMYVKYIPTQSGDVADSLILTSGSYSLTVALNGTDKVIVGSGTATNAYLPSYSYYSYSLTQQIYTPAEIGTPGYIYSIDIYNEGLEQTRNLDLYLVHTDKQTFANGTDWIPVTENDKVFSGVVTMVSGAWTTFQINNFAYDGESNLALVVDDNTGTWENSMNCRVFYAQNQALRVYDDYTNYDPTNPSNYNGAVLSQKNQLRIGITPAVIVSCGKPSNLVFSNLTTTSVSVSWSNGSGTFGYEYKKSSDTVWTVACQDNCGFNCNLTGLLPNTTYQFRVRSVCAGNTISAWLAGSFTTLADCSTIYTLPFFEGFDSGSLPECWQAIDSDGDGYTWDAAYWNDNLGYSGYGHTGAGCVASASYINNVGALTPNNWLISPPIAIPSQGASLSFWARVHGYPEPVEVLVSTTGNAIANFTGAALLTQTITSDTYTEYTVNLAAYAGQNIYIAFVHRNVTDQYWLMLDDVSVYYSPTNPGIVANPTTLDFDTVVLGQSSAVKTSDVSAYNLINSITATTTAPFEISADGTTFATTATVAQTGGTLYMRYTPTAIGAATGTVTLSSTGASDVFITMTGYGFDTICSIPSDLFVTETGLYRAMLSWTENGTATGWQICLDEDESNLITVASLSYMFTNLSSGMHFFKVRANCGSDGYSGWSNSVSVYISPCESPYNLKTTASVAGTASISWQGNSDGYNLRYRPSGNSGWTLVTGLTSTTYTISGLVAGDYEVEVAAVCDSLNWIPTTFSIMEVLSTANWYGYAGYYSEYYKFVSFSMQNPAAVSYATGTLHSLSENWYALAAAYANGYVWCITQDGDLSRATLDNNNKTISEFETIIPGFENTYSNSMSYNPVDGRIYYNMFDERKLKSFDPLHPEDVTEIGTYNINVLTFAINSAGEAYCVEISTGDLYRLYLNDASSAYIGNTGKNVNYAQSMAFDLQTNELFWAQYYSSDNCGLYKVNPSTAATCLVGQIGGGNGTEFTGLFMGDNAVIACPAPSNLTATLTQGNAPMAMLSWTENGNATSWQVCINGDETNLITVNTTSYTLANLPFGTSYTVKVRARCGTDSYSYWSGIVSFTTDFCMPENQCKISCMLQDSYGDGWNGGAIKVVDALTNIVLSTWTMSGSYAADTLLVCDGRNIRFEWVSGNYDYECSYTVLNADGDTIFSGSGTMSDNVVYAVDCHLVHYDHIYVTENGTGDGSSWTTATGDLQWALNTALNIRNTYGVTPDVWVAAGTYYGDTTSSNAFTMVEGVNVYGGFAGNEPANYDLSQRNFVANETVLDGKNARQVLSSSHFNNATLWDGFTIRHGRGNTGAGVLLFTNAEIRHCSIMNNKCFSGGGGVYSDHGSVSNCLIANNTAVWGGGMVSLYSSVVNTTIVRNSSNSSGVYGDENSVFTNCIIWGNKLSDGTPGNLYGTSTCSYSAIEGGCQGDSIIALNAGNSPLFVNPSLTAGADDVTANVDWHLHPGSPCINAGDNSAVTDAFDMDGNLRIYHGRVDMGCYEWQGSQVIPVGDAQPCADVPTVADFDEITYNTVKVGNQCWMKENLRSTHYSDGTVIPLGNFSTSESTPYCYWPGNNSNNVPAYGYLYNWSAVMCGMNSNNANPSAVQGVCPVGWHVPSAAEWSQLFDYVKGESVYRCGTDSNNIAKALASIWGWNSTQTECAVGNDAGQNNLTGFGAMPAGNFYGLYDNFNSVAFFWTSSDTTVQPNYNTYSSVPFPIFCAVNSLSPNVESRTEYKSQGFSVRCLKNDTLVADYSGIIFVTPSGAGDHSGSSWANATSSIDTAQILAQEHNAVVWVAAGTYYGDTTSSNAFTMVEGVNVYGGFAGNEPANYDLSQRDFVANETALDGDSARRVLYQPNDFNIETEWDGFTIQHGQTSGNGGGAYLRRNAVLSQCRIQGNVSSSDISGGGGGVYCNNASVDKCNVYGNTSLYNGGGVYATNSTVSDCRIERNAVSNHYPNPQYYGGGGIRASSSTITGCRIKGNQSAVAGGGVFSSGAVLSGCEILENTAVNRGGGIDFTGSNSRVTDCLVGNNTATNVGGGISGGGMVVNTTIVRNTSTGDGAGVNGTSSATQITLTNCIVWGNERNGAPDNVGGNLTCSHSAIEGGHEGDSIIVLNDINQPLFVNPSLTAGASDSTANVDWHLQNGSVCVNRGSNAAVTDILDLDGTARVKRDTVDLGCYESDFYSVPVLYCTTVYGEFAATACDSYTWNDQVYSHSGDYQQTFPLANGCDSIATLHLTVNHAATTNEYLTICASDLPYLYRDTLLDISTPQLLTINSQLLTQNGCDSTVILFLTVTPSTVGNFAAMTPTNNYPITAYPIRFTWDAVENASNYDLYVWPVGDPQPQQPTASHIHGTSYTLSSLANRGAYQWSMTAYNACDTSVSSTRQFTLNVTPTLTVNTNNPVDMGEVQLNGARSIWFQVNGNALDSVISYQLTGADSAAFTLVPTATWDSLRGGRMQLTFHPTVAQAEYTAQMTFYSDTLVRTFTIKGHLADYLTFTTYVDTNIYAMDSQIPIHGRVTNPLNEPVAGLEVEVYVNVMDYVRTFPAISDANGQFTVMFTPQHSEAGYYTVGSRRAGGNSTAVHDDFNIPGMMLASSDWILWEPTIDQPDTGVIAVRNRSQIPLTNIQVTPVSLPNGCTVQFVPLNLAGMATGNLQFIVSGSEVSTGVNYEEVRLNAVSSEGAAMSFSAWYYCMPQRAALDVTPTSLITTMTRGKSKIVDFKIYNNGTGPTGDIYVSLPNVPWMSVVGSDTLPSLAVHDSAYVSIRLSADSTTALVRYTGNFVINCERGEGVSVPYSITAISDSTGTLLVDVTDEYTWNTNGGHGPHLAGANVTVKGYYSLETVAMGVTDANGHFVVSDLPEGYYKLIVRADRHAEYQGALLITAGDTNRQDIFIQFQAITYSWEVVPTEIQDEYTYELNVDFETHVPKPVVTMELDRSLTLPEDCQTAEFNVIATNHGLIAALDFSLIMPQSDYLVFTPLINHIDSFPAQTTYIIPVRYQRKDCAELGYTISTGPGDSINPHNPNTPNDNSGFGSGDPDCYYCNIKCYKKFVEATYRYICRQYYWEIIPSYEITYVGVPLSNCVDSNPHIPRVGGRTICPFVVGGGGGGIDTSNKYEPIELIEICDTNLTPCQNAINGVLGCIAPIKINQYNEFTLDGEGAILDLMAELLEKLGVPGVSTALCVGSIIADIPNIIACIHSLTHNHTPDIRERDLETVLNLYEQFDPIPYYMQHYSVDPLVYDLLLDQLLEKQLPANTGIYRQGQITPTGRAAILDTCQTIDSSITVVYLVNDAVDRWNNTVVAWDSGYYRIIDAPIGYDTNFAQIDTGLVRELYVLNAEAVSQGYINIFERYNESVIALENAAIDYRDNQNSSSVCASVTVQFSQKMTMTREAFQGTLTINNGHESQPMQDIDVNFVIRDVDGVDCTNLFQINFQSYNNMTGSNGSLVLDALNEGSIVVQFIPTKQAAPTMPKQYSFGGSFSFIDPFTGEFMTYNLYPVDIMVNPCPDLYVNYFMQRDILGDDPLTEDRIEPIVPAELGVIIHNRGAGMAKNVLLETAEPKIIDNEKGLAVDFAMYGAAFNGNERQLGLMEIPFGNIEPGRTGVGEWWFTSTLLGHFVSYEAHVIHNNSFGNPDLSLVSSLDIHPLIHTVYAYGNLDDGINDFLVDDVDDIRNYPDSLYFSNGSRTAVATADSISFDHYVTPIDTIVILTLDPSRIGWNYEQTWDPGRGQYKLVSCTRNSDQQVIPLSNVWQSHVTIPVGADPIYENRLHIVDTLSNDLPTTYTLVFSLYDLVLEVDSIRGVPDTIMQTPLTSVIVKFNKSIVDSTFTYSDMSLRCNNGPNLLDENLQIEKLDSVTYRLHLAPYTTQSGYYVLNIQTLDITDTVGFNGYYGKQVTWIQNIQTCLPVLISVAETICQGETYIFHGRPLVTAGSYTDTLQTVHGCDSIVTLHLTVNHGDYVEVSMDTCGAGFYWPLADTIVSQSGTYYHYSTNVNSCMDTTVLMLSLHRPALTELTAQICAGEVYDQNGFNVSTAGDHYLNLQTVYGCDSVVILHLTVGSEAVTHLVASICEGESYNGNGFEITAPAAGVHDYSNTIARPGSCDSIVVLHLTVNHSTTGDTTAIVCGSFNWYGTTYTQSGDYTHTLTNAAGCDSIVTLHLTVNYTTYGNITAVACDSYDWYGTTYTQSGDYTHTLTNANGCDSIVTLHLTVNHTTYGNITVVACDSYDWYGTTYMQSGDYTHTLTNAEGCDSVVTLHLTVNQPTYGDTTAVACDSYDWYGTTYTQSGDYTHTLTNAHGCDSIVTLHLTVNHSTYGNVTAVACDSYDWYGTTYTQSGDYTHTLTNAHGCDSIVTLHLTVNHSTTGSITAVACNSYDWYGTTYTHSGNYTHTLTNAHGCDSIVMLHLTVNYTTYGNITAVACNSYDWYGTTYTQSGDYTHTLTNVNGCDSIMTLHLTVNHSTTGDITAVACDSYDWY
ncbi:MAG: C10 family peptidase, partial [Bacteroidales bacterium]|nr:C10 family peptidase [Bacteroidales bacterium]